MPFLLVGLGNIGTQYAHTRHNAGFLLVESLRELWGFPPFEQREKFSARVSEGTVQGQKVILVQPTTFMNASGRAVSALTQFYKIDPSQILLFSDDKDMICGKLRFRPSGSSGGQNGIKDICQALGTQDIARYKYGVATEKLTHMTTADFVLSAFTPQERADLHQTALTVLAPAVVDWIRARV